MQSPFTLLCIVQLQCCEYLNVHAQIISKLIVKADNLASVVAAAAAKQ
jgi:hypothetical protein